ncbi:MAG: N-acetylmuramoyl-L-alanine amidase [Defluviitaleaceae bacterium]|nr:N-acetylmuramoyl-L-alanine amidase [Defluviitaleaceae bacterium]
MPKKIFIDAGHNNSGWNTGVEAYGLREQDITYNVARLLGDMLAPQLEVKLSRSAKETNLGRDNSSAINARWQAANDWGADLFLSIHVNSGGGTGVETFYFKETSTRSQASLDFATVINNTYAAETGLKNRGVKLDTSTAVGSVAVLRHTKMPAILLELAFIDSPSYNPDVELLNNKQTTLAKALANGILKYAGVPPTPKISFSLLGHQTYIDGQIINGTTYCQARPLLEALGYTVSWDSSLGVVVTK